VSDDDSNPGSEPETKRPRLDVGIEQRADGWHAITRVYDAPPDAEQLNTNSGPYATREIAEYKALEAAAALALARIFPGKWID
jgi:hypothetical protein